MNNIYDKYKCDYNNYVLLIKNGNFYTCLKSDASVMNSIFNYKIIETKKYIRSGFPLGSLLKVTNRLIELNINYLVIDKDIVEKKKFKDNNYQKYLKFNNYSIIINRINNISNILKNNINNSNIKIIIEDIEGIICKISY